MISTLCSILERILNERLNEVEWGEGAPFFYFARFQDFPDVQMPQNSTGLYVK